MLMTITNTNATTALTAQFLLDHAMMPWKFQKHLPQTLAAAALLAARILNEEKVPWTTAMKHITGLRESNSFTLAKSILNWAKQFKHDNTTWEVKYKNAKSMKKKLRQLQYSHSTDFNYDSYAY